MSDTQGLKGQQKTEHNRRAYAAYVEKLRATGGKFPSNQFGDVSVEGVAKAIGCTPKVLKEGALKNLFAQDAADIGVEVAPQSESKLAKKAEEKSREASFLYKRLNQKIKEVEELEAKVERLTRRVLELETRRGEDDLSLKELLKSGRRFTL